MKRPNSPEQARRIGQIIREWNRSHNNISLLGGSRMTRQEELNILNHKIAMIERGFYPTRQDILQQESSQRQPRSILNASQGRKVVGF